MSCFKKISIWQLIKVLKGEIRFPHVPFLESIGDFKPVFTSPPPSLSSRACIRTFFVPRQCGVATPRWVPGAGRRIGCRVCRCTAQPWAAWCHRAGSRTPARCTIQYCIYTIYTVYSRGSRFSQLEIRIWGHSAFYFTVPKSTQTTHAKAKI